MDVYMTLHVYSGVSNVCFPVVVQVLCGGDCCDRGLVSIGRLGEGITVLQVTLMGSSKLKVGIAEAI